MPETAVHVGSGKVRELYELEDNRLLLVASDRISTFDVVLPTPIPDKGRVLTGLSVTWFDLTGDMTVHGTTKAIIWAVSAAFAPDADIIVNAVVGFAGLEATLAAHLASLREMIARDRNHPSVIMWSIGNEIQGASTAGARASQRTPAAIRIGPMNMKRRGP